MQRLLSFALDGKVADPVALQAIRDALDRAGLKPGLEIEVGVSLKPFESILEQIEGGSRRSHTTRLGGRHTRRGWPLSRTHTTGRAEGDGGTRHCR